MNQTQDIVRLVKSLGEKISDDWKGIDAVYPLIEMIKNEGGIFMIKVDGERTNEDDTGMFTVVVSKGKLEEGGAIRIDTETLEEGLSYALIKYAQVAWS